MWFRKIRFRKEIKKRLEPVHPSNRKPVMLFSKDGYIKTYPSIQAASEATGIGCGAIWHCVTGRNKKTHAQYWNRGLRECVNAPDTKEYKWVTWEYVK